MADVGGHGQRRHLGAVAAVIGAVLIVTACNGGSPKASSTVTTTVPRAAKVSAASVPEGGYALEIDTNGCGLFPLGAVTMTVKGGTATIDVPATEDPTGTPDLIFTGTITGHGGAFKVSTRNKNPGTPLREDPIIELAGTVAGTALTGTSKFSGLIGDGGTGYSCDQAFSGQSTSASGTTTTAVAPASTAPTLPPAGPTDAGGLPAGLKCADLLARGLPFTAAMDYWNLYNHPAVMDADHNGVPCETVYPRADITAYQAAHAGVPTTVSTGAPPCDLNHFIGDPGEDIAIDGISCIGTFAIVKNHDSTSGATYPPIPMHWDPSLGGWTGFLTGPAVPECTEAPAQYRQYACAPQ